MTLRDEIYKRGHTIESFSSITGLSRWTIMMVCNKKTKPRGDTIYLIAEGLNMPYDKVKRMIENGL